MYDGSVCEVPFGEAIGEVSVCPSVNFQKPTIFTSQDVRKTDVILRKIYKFRNWKTIS